MIYNAFDIVAVPFPFTDSAQSKKRPALVLSSAKKFGGLAGHSVMLMITSARNEPWPLDVLIADQDTSGLTNPSVARMKMFTIDNRLIIKKVGSLSSKDQKELKKALKILFADVLL